MDNPQFTAKQIAIAITEALAQLFPDAVFDDEQLSEIYKGLALFYAATTQMVFDKSGYNEVFYRYTGLSILLASHTDSILSGEYKQGTLQ